VVGGANRKHWLLMLEALGASELASDSRFVNGSDRMAHLKELEAVLSDYFRKNTRAHWLAALDAKGVPCGPVHDMLEALEDPQTLARDMVVEVEHSTLGAVKTIGLPVKFSETPGKVLTGAPVYGEHTAEVLLQHGFGEEEIAMLVREKAVFAAPTESAGQQVA
jgi:crotonobetainyl-CoA:carnitine CoA-transferase CaiB-like acyl-CoA transferase